MVQSRTSLPPGTATEPASARIIAVLALLACLAPVATDMYLPAFEAMAASLGTGERELELTLSSFFLGLAVGQACYGPIIDRYGRRGPLLIGCALYIAATIGCLLTPDIEVMVVLRFVQAMGGSAGMIIGRAMIFDRQGPTQGAQALSLLMMLTVIAPILAPLSGGMLLAVGGWRSIFVAMLVFGVVCLALSWKFLPETLAADQRSALRPGDVGRTYLEILSAPGFIVPAIVVGLAQGRMFAFITASPGVIVGQFGYTAVQFSWIFALTALGIILTAQLNRALLKSISPERLLGASLVFGVIVSLLLVSPLSGTSSVLYLTLLALAVASLGLTSSNAAALAMGAVRTARGGASGLVGTFQFGLGFLASSATAALPGDQARGLAWMVAALSLGAALLWLLETRRPSGFSTRP